MKNVHDWENRSTTGDETAREEGTVAKAIESQTAKLPSDLFLWVAGGAVAGSLTLRLLGKKDAANWVGEWAPTLLILGVYNKMVKLLGHDETDRSAA
jgi:hypothetical protein